MAPSCEGGGSTPLVTEFTLDEMKNASNTSLAVFDTNKEQDSFSSQGPHKYILDAYSQG